MSGPYAQGFFSDQFESETGQNTSMEYSFEVPHNCLLRKAQVWTMAVLEADAYITVLLNDVEIVPAGAVPPDRNLTVDTEVGDSFDLDNIEANKGDKITVRLNLTLLNTVTRCKVLLAYAAIVQREIVPSGYLGYY